MEEHMTVPSYMLGSPPVIDMTMDSSATIPTDFQPQMSGSLILDYAMTPQETADGGHDTNRPSMEDLDMIQGTPPFRCPRPNSKCEKKEFKDMDKLK